MPFITLDEFKSTIMPGADKLYFTNPEHFVAVEAQAAEIIKENTGIAVPADAAEAPAWVKLPASWLINYIALTRNADPRQEDLEHGERLYEKAIDLLSKHRVASSPAGTFKTAEIEGMESW